MVYFCCAVKCMCQKLKFIPGILNFHNKTQNGTNQTHTTRTANIDNDDDGDAQRNGVNLMEFRKKMKMFKRLVVSWWTTQHGVPRINRSPRADRPTITCIGLGLLPSWAVVGSR